MVAKERDVVRKGTLNLDMNMFYRNRDGLEDRMKLAEIKLNEAVGREIDVNSYDDMHGLFIKECQQKPIKVGKKGRISFAKDVIANWQTPYTESVIDIKGIKGRLKYFKVAGKYILDETERTHQIPFELTVGSTGRLHARNTSVQSFPDELRECIVPDPGHVFFGFNYVAQELCIMAYDVGCQKLIDDIRRGVDVFQNIEDAIGIDKDKVKTAIYAYLYGAKLSLIANKIFIPEQVVEEIFRLLFDIYPELSIWILHQAEEIRKQGYTSTISGRKYTIDPEAVDFEEEEVRAAKFKMQGSGADVLNEVIAEVDKNSFLTYIISVFDSLLVQVHFNNAMMKRVEDLESFMGSRLNNCFKVKMLQGNSWAEAVRIKEL